MSSIFTEKNQQIQVTKLKPKQRTKISLNQNKHIPTREEEKRNYSPYYKQMFIVHCIDNRIPQATNRRLKTT